MKAYASSIIAVHGLNPRSKSAKEHAWNTWKTPSDDSDRLWLREDLPASTPEARIFLYQYDATAFWGDNRSSFSDKANRLLEDIQIEREEDPRRPLILIGHSLGGLLIKQGLVNAFNSTDEKFGAIGASTTGLVFFATPHAGGQGQLVKLGDYIAKFAMSLNIQRGDNILEILKSSSLAADTLREHWRHRLDKFDIVSFWGNRDSIVEKESARFGLPGDREKWIILDADHHTICRFGPDEDDQHNLKIVKSRLKELYAAALSTMQPLNAGYFLNATAVNLLQFIQDEDNKAQSSAEHANLRAERSQSLLQNTQSRIHTELASALLLALGLVYSGSSLGPVTGSLGGLLGIAGLGTTYRRSVETNSRTLERSLADLAEASYHLDGELVEALRRTALLRKYEQEDYHIEKESWKRNMREIQEAHENLVGQLVEQSIEANEMVAKMRRNQEEAASTTANGTRWFITSVVSRTKAFIAYLARWIS
ncbi:hypothetical protein DPV78_000268 [Talaromyces pinophilus]|nr:hypothetical protein DPV78_000268 [Talaromyces pinophilus]